MHTNTRLFNDLFQLTSQIAQEIYLYFFFGVFLRACKPLIGYDGQADRGIMATETLSVLLQPNGSPGCAVIPRRKKKISFGP